VPSFENLRDNGGSFIVRLSRSHNPTVVAAWADGVRLELPEPPLQPRLCDFVAKHSQQRMDLDVEYPRGPRAVGFRVIVVPGREQGMTRLCTNLGRGRFSLDTVARLYRFRWQVELCFKEWKSYANLHKFNTANEREEALRSRKPTGVLQEVAGIALAYNLARAEMTRVAEAEGLPSSRISFRHALMLTRNFCLAAWATSPGAVPRRLGSFEKDMRLLVLPERRAQRRYPRHVKIKMSNYARNRGKSGWAA
jgi:hypothetical protein